MGHRLRILPVEDGLVMREKACEHYVCRSCGRRMISVNFVNGICIQVFVSHSGDCRVTSGSAFARTGEVTCETCSYFDPQAQCTFCGECNPAMESVRTAGGKTL